MGVDSFLCELVNVFILNALFLLRFLLHQFNRFYLVASIARAAQCIYIMHQQAQNEMKQKVYSIQFIFDIQLGSLHYMPAIALIPIPYICPAFVRLGDWNKT